LVKYTKSGKIYKITIKNTKWPQNRPNSHKIYQHLPLRVPPKFTQIKIFGLKICHLETLFRKARPFVVVCICWAKIIQIIDSSTHTPEK
jgi:hypothetical protein